MKKTALAALLSATFVAPVMAQQLYGFSTLSLNYLNWGSKAASTGKSDFVFAEAEGGAGFTWGEVYGFFDIENLGDGSDAISYFGKAMLDVNLGQTPWMFHTHAAGATGSWGHDLSTFAGIAYKFNGDNGAFFKPYLAARHTTSDGYTGMNGYQFGFAWSYPFQVGEQRFTLAQWHETDFNRDEQYTWWANSKSVGHNGAVSVWWNAAEKVQLGLQYRYADQHLGASPYQTGVVTTVKYYL